MDAINITDNFYYNWPLTLVIIGGHEPQWVEGVLARVRELDQPNEVIEDVLTLMTGYMIIVAREEVARN